MSNAQCPMMSIGGVGKKQSLFFPIFLVLVLYQSLHLPLTRADSSPECVFTQFNERCAQWYGPQARCHRGWCICDLGYRQTGLGMNSCQVVECQTDYECYTRHYGTRCETTTDTLPLSSSSDNSAKGGRCVCADGFHLNQDSQTCVPDPPVPPTPPLVSTPTTITTTTETTETRPTATVVTTTTTSQITTTTTTLTPTSTIETTQTPSAEKTTEKTDLITTDETPSDTSETTDFTTSPTSPEYSTDGATSSSHGTSQPPSMSTTIASTPVTKVTETTEPTDLLTTTTPAVTTSSLLPETDTTEATPSRTTSTETLTPTSDVTTTTKGQTVSNITTTFTTTTVDRPTTTIESNWTTTIESNWTTTIESNTTTVESNGTTTTIETNSTTATIDGTTTTQQTPCNLRTTHLIQDGSSPSGATSKLSTETLLITFPVGVAVIGLLSLLVVWWALGVKRRALQAASRRVRPLPPPPITEAHQRVNEAHYAVNQRHYQLHQRLIGASGIGGAGAGAWPTSSLSSYDHYSLFNSVIETKPPTTINNTNYPVVQFSQPERTILEDNENNNNGSYPFLSD